MIVGPYFKGYMDLNVFTKACTERKVSRHTVDLIYLHVRQIQRACSSSVVDVPSPEHYIELGQVESEFLSDFLQHYTSSALLRN